MQVTLLYYDKAHAALGRPLLAGERVIFGRGDRADFQVSGENIAEAHLSIENDGQGVWAHRLVDSMAPVMLNELPLEKSEVDDGDIVTVGNTKIRLQIRNRALASTRQPEPKTPPAKTNEALQIVGRELSTGLVLYHDPSLKTPVQEVAKRLLSKLEPLLFANFRAAGEMPAPPLACEDLLAQAPAEIRDGNSLHLVAAADLVVGDSVAPLTESPELLRDRLLELFHKLRLRKGGILAFTKAPKEEILKAASFRRGFYCSADALEMFLRQGSRELAQGLVNECSAILIVRDNDENWSLYASPRLAPSSSDLGLSDTIYARPTVCDQKLF